MRRMLRVVLSLMVLTALLAVPVTASASSDDDPVYQEDEKALIGKVQGIEEVFGYDEVSFIYEISVDQLRLRNGNSHKAWLVPDTTEGLVVYVEGTTYAEEGEPVSEGITNEFKDAIEVSCPHFDFDDGSDSFTDGNLPIACEWSIPSAETGGTLDLTFKRGGPGVKAVGNTVVGDEPTIVLDGATFAGTFEYPSGEVTEMATVAVVADVLRFGDGPGLIEYVIPESHKKSVENFSGNGFQVKCPFDGPGVETVDSIDGSDEDPAEIVCTWKAGYGGGKPSGTVTLTTGTPLPLDTPTTLGGGDGGTLDVRAECADDADCAPLTVTFDEGVDEDGNPFIALTKSPPDWEGVILEVWTSELETSGSPELVYDDVAPFDDDLREMERCSFDPRVHVDGEPTFDIRDEFVARTEPGSESGSGAVMPAGETSCWIELDFEIPTEPGEPTNATAVVFSIDGFRTWR